MAKFELPVYNCVTGEVEKTCKRGFMPVSLYIRFQEFSDKVTGEKFKSDKEFFVAMKDLFLEMFPDMTEAEYLNQTDVAQVLALFGKIINKSTELETGDSKNV